MRQFTISFNQSDPHDTSAIRFTAEDPMRALAILEQHPQHERATVWEGARKLCCISRSGVDVWHIS